MPSRDEAERTDDASKQPDAARIPRLFTSSSAFPAHSQQQGFFKQPHSAFPHQSAADVMLGLKTLATHADRQVPILSHDGNPMPTFPSLRVTSSLSSSFSQRMAPSTTSRLFPPVITTSREILRGTNSRQTNTGQANEDSENKVSPVRFGEYLGRKHKRGESRVSDDVLSPTSRSHVYGSDREITLSPPSTGSSEILYRQWSLCVEILTYELGVVAVPGPRILPVATTIAWRSSSSIFSPNSKRLRASSPESIEAKAPFTLAPLEPQRRYAEQELVSISAYVSYPANIVSPNALLLVHCQYRPSPSPRADQQHQEQADQCWSGKCLPDGEMNWTIRTGGNRASASNGGSPSTPRGTKTSCCS